MFALTGETATHFTSKNNICMKHASALFSILSGFTMKKMLLHLAVLLLGISHLHAQEIPNDTSLYYYYQGERVYLQVVPDKIMVKFESGVSLERAKEELKYYQEVGDLKDNLNYTLKDLLVVNVRAGINSGRVKEVLSAISNNPSVLHVSHLMVGSQENIKVATDGKIIIKLKENGREEQLIAFLKNYVESVIEKDNYALKSYFLKFKALSTNKFYK
ncbi:MAG: hypothetical protein M9931_09880 [Chitinophagales bacterium]|nr:hypothetical protein [Chitinophagales bacterium]